MLKPARALRSGPRALIAGGAMLLAASGGVRAAPPVPPEGAPLPSVSYPSRDPDTKAPAPPVAVARPERASDEPSPYYYEGGVWGYRDRAGRFRAGRDGFAREERRLSGRGIDRTTPVSSRTATDRGFAFEGRRVLDGRASDGLPNVSGNGIVGHAPSAWNTFSPHAR